MYDGLIFEKDWPQPADAATYSQYFDGLMWHVEEAASLVHGFVPRKNIFARPTDGIGPGRTLPTGKQRPLGPKSQTWAQLLDGPIGNTMSRYIRYIVVADGQFNEEQPYVDPSKFLQFCGVSGISIPSELKNIWDSWEKMRRGSPIGPRKGSDKDEMLQRLMAALPLLRKESKTKTLKLTSLEIYNITFPNPLDRDKWDSETFARYKLDFVRAEPSIADIWSDRPGRPKVAS